MKFKPAALSLALSLCFFVLSVSAQVPAGSINGRVTDPKGALVAGAHVSAVNTAQGRSFETVSNGSGIYVLPDLPAGSYTLKVLADGFAAREVRDISIEAGRATTVDAALTVAGAESTVKVDAAATSINVTQSMIQGQITSKTIESIPLNGRNFLELAYLVPGNRPAPLRPYQDQYARGKLRRRLWPRRKHHR